MTVLLVDDDPEIRLIVSYLLSEAGHTVLEAADAAAAHAHFEAAPPDLVLMDVMLGADDGIAVGAAMLQRGARLVYLTGASRPEQQGRMRAAGPAGILQKPFDPTSFVAQLEHILDR